MEPRPTLSEADALMLLNFELSAYDECADCRFTSIRPVKIAGESGCNRKICECVVDEVRGSCNIAG